VNVLITLGSENRDDYVGREPDFTVDCEVNFLIDSGLNGVILWTHDTESSHDGPYQVSQMLYEMADGILTETRHETTGEFFEELPSSPPID